MKKIIPYSITGIIGSIVFGTIFLLLGISIGGNYDFIEIPNHAGYETGGLIFGLIGITLGSIIGIRIHRKIPLNKYLVSAIIISTTINSVLVIYLEHLYTLMIVLLIPTIITLTTIEISDKKNN